jgi:diguanylate cyclase (GGDEF)-like protein/PAS domain S-box-containing protein
MPTRSYSTWICTATLLTITAFFGVTARAQSADAHSLAVLDQLHRVEDSFAKTADAEARMSNSVDSVEVEVIGALENCRANLDRLRKLVDTGAPGSDVVSTLSLELSTHQSRLETLLRSGVLDRLSQEAVALEPRFSGGPVSRPSGSSAEPQSSSAAPWRGNGIWIAAIVLLGGVIAVVSRRSAARRYEQMLLATADAILICSRTGEILRSTGRVGEVLRWDQSALVGCDLGAIFPPHTGMVAALNNVLRSGRPEHLVLPYQPRERDLEARVCLSGGEAWILINDTVGTADNSIWKSVCDVGLDGVMNATVSGEILYCNAATRQLLGLGDKEDVTRFNLADIHPSGFRNRMRTEIAAALVEDGVWEGETHLVTRNGKQIPVLEKIVAQRGEHGVIERICLMLHDQSERRWIEAQMQRHIALTQEYMEDVENTRQALAHTEARLEEAQARIAAMTLNDPLTGAFNQRSLIKRLTEEFQRSVRYNRPLSALVMDVDGFERINAELGRAAGDAVLCSVTEALQRACRTSDLVARTSADEFVVVLTETDARASMEAAERFKNVLSGIRSGVGTVTVSFGAATRDANVNQPLDLIASAREAMQASRCLGGNSITHADEVRATPALRISYAS